MARLTAALILATTLTVSLVLAPLSMAGPIPQTQTLNPAAAPSVNTDTPSVPSPTIAFTLGPGSLPHPTASAPASSSSSLVLEMDWLS